MNRFWIFTNKEKDESLTVTKWVYDFLTGHGKEAVIKIEDFSERKQEETTDEWEGADCAVVLGGDGTIIRTANRLLKTGTPLFGINLGTLGFLTETELPVMERGLTQLLAGKYEIERRMMLDVRVGEEFSDTALNDIVITRSGFSRLINIRVYVNDELVNSYRGDGVIISTPTGSTGYNLSAGGPVVLPRAELTLITPICPHSLNARTIVVSAGDRLCLVIEKEKKTQEEEAIITVDGRNAGKLQANDRIVIEKSAYTTNLVRLSDRTFFQILRGKLGNQDKREDK